MKAVSPHLRLLSGALLGLVIVGCGPTANAIRPTLPPRTAQPAVSFQPDGTPSGGEQPGAGSSGTPQPPGVATPMAGFPQGSAYEVTGVTTTPTGFLAVGFAGAGQGYFGVHQGVTWTSTDGSTWQQSVDPTFLDVSPTNVVSMGNDVYLFGKYETCSDVLDDECTPDPNTGLVIFKSTSGGPWQQLAQPADIVQAQFDGITVWGTNLVAWGAAADDSGTTTVWTSPDGLTWTPATGIAGLDPVDSMGAGGQGLVAFGSKYDDELGDTQLVAASSSDGVHYTSANAPKVTGGTIANLAAGPGGVAGVGYAESDTSPSVALTVFSADGTNWTQTTASDGSFDNSLINEVHSTDHSFVAVGSSIDQNDMTLQAGQIWVSADGQSWRSLGSFGGTFDQYGGSALGPAGLVVFTENEQDANEDGTDVATTINGWLVPAAQLAP